MRVSCGCPIDKARNPEALENWIRQVGLTPIITNTIIRCVYEGNNTALGEAIIKMFEVEADHDITVFYDKAEQAKSAKKAARKQERAKRNAKLHGHK